MSIKAFIGASVIVGGILFAGAYAGAQTSCLLYPSGSNPPSGYGASYGVFSPSKPLLVYTNCPTAGRSVTLSVGNPGTNQAVYKYAFSYQNGGWIQHTLSGTTLSGDWLSANGTVGLTAPSNTSASQPLYLVGYVCTSQGGVWKCGCANSTCNSPMWQLQAYAGTGGGGTTGGSQPVGDDLALCYPGSGQTVPVADKVELAGRLTSAQPGDHLVLEGGTYLGFIYSKNGTAQNPIVIEAAPGSVVTFTGSVTMGGSYGVLKGVSFNQSGRIKLTGHHNRITRNYFFDQSVGSGGVIETQGDGIHDNRIDHNSFQRISGAAYRSDGFGSVTNNQRSRIDHNYIQNHTVGGDNESVFLTLTDAFNDGFIMYDNNLFDDVLNGRTNQAEVISVKTGRTIVRNNTFQNSDNIQLTFRETNRSIAEGNYFADGAGARIFGDDNVIRNNIVVGGGYLGIYGGDGTMDNRPGGCEKSDVAPTFPPPACNTIHAASRDTLVEDNAGAIRVGENHTGDSIPAQNTILRRNSGPMTMKNQTNTDNQGGSPNNTARRLTTSDVGPQSPDPSCR